VCTADETANVRIKAEPSRQVIYQNASVMRVEVGSIINCTADGRPLPTFYWQNQETGVNLPGRSLRIDARMVDGRVKHYVCVSRNEVAGTSYIAARKIIFVAGKTHEFMVLLQYLGCRQF
jgi:hypothetical protein